MTDRKPSAVPEQSNTTVVEPLSKVFESVAVIATCARDISNARTERVRIQEQARVQLARIHSARDTILAYLDRSFDERRQNFERLFSTLDKALEDDRIEVVAETLKAVVALAKESPFKALADAQRAAQLLEDKDHEHVI